MTRFSLKIFCLLILVKPLYFANSFGADLVDIRTGFHRTYSRVAIEFNSSVRYQLIKNENNHSVTIDVRSIQAVRNVRSVSIDPIDPFLKQVRYTRNSQSLLVTTYLKSPAVKIDYYHMNWPFRIVIDIYSSQARFRRRGSEVVMSPRMAANTTIVEKDSSQSVSTDSVTVVGELNNSNLDSASTESNIPKEVLERTAFAKDVFFEPFAAEASKDSTTQAVYVNAETARAKNKVFWFIGAAFLLFDLALLSLYFNKRTKRRAGLVKPRQKKNTPPEPAIAGLPSKQFAELLKTSLQSEQLRPSVNSGAEDMVADLETITKAVKLDSMIGSLSEAMSEENLNPPSPPEFKEIFQDLELVASASEISEQIAKEQLIGKDGIDFMKNIKRLYLN